MLYLQCYNNRIMKKITIILLIITILLSCNNETNLTAKISEFVVGGGNVNKNFEFSGGAITLEVLNNYLMRAVTEGEFLSHQGYYIDGQYPYSDDDERMLKNIGAKFIGRSIYLWGSERYLNDPLWMAKASAKAERMHQYDPDLIFQAAILNALHRRLTRFLFLIRYL